MLGGVCQLVAPLAGAWIEISLVQLESETHCVAPLAGAWIEIFLVRAKKILTDVAPLAGAWIEISARLCKISSTMSLPLRERGLKLLGDLEDFCI